MSLTTAANTTRVKFATQISPEILNELRQISKREGRQIQAIVEEALKGYLATVSNNRPSVMDALRESITEHDSLYEALSK